MPQMLGRAGEDGSGRGEDTDGGVGCVEIARHGWCVYASWTWFMLSSPSHDGRVFES